MQNANTFFFNAVLISVKQHTFNVPKNHVMCNILYSKFSILANKCFISQDRKEIE